MICQCPVSYCCHTAVSYSSVFTSDQVISMSLWSIVAMATCGITCWRSAMISLTRWMTLWNRKQQQQRRKRKKLRWYRSPLPPHHLVALLMSLTILLWSQTSAPHQLISPTWTLEPAPWGIAGVPAVTPPWQPAQHQWKTHIARMTSCPWQPKTWCAFASRSRGGWNIWPPKRFVGGVCKAGSHWGQTEVTPGSNWGLDWGHTGVTPRSHQGQTDPGVCSVMSRHRTVKN